jgi:predicted DsbA family dithiol-disulfide isomerase
VPHVRIEIWSDVVCPWCYIGKRRLERALAGFPHADEVEVVWRSFQLDPDAPREAVESVAEALGRKYGGGPEGGLRMVEQVKGVAAEEGLRFRHEDSLRVSTVDAHRLLHLAHAEGGPEAQGRLKEALLDAYFVQTRNVADPDTLTELATDAGLDEVRVKEVLAGDTFADEVEADAREAAALGARGVPFFVVDRRYGVAGAQPVEVFTSVLEQAWRDSHPALDLVAGRPGYDAVCGPDGCDD